MSNLALVYSLYSSRQGSAPVCNVKCGDGSPLEHVEYLRRGPKPQKQSKSLWTVVSKLWFEIRVETEAKSRLKRGKKRLTEVNLR